ncbi:MAG: NAD(P)-dependent oxidoreductase [Gammaproteobacteria bacterium]
MGNLNQKTVFITGASRGIGREIALTFAKAGANIVIAAKSTEPHPKLLGTIYTVRDEVEALGQQALAIALDVRNEAAIDEAMHEAASKFGGLDILVNNASAINLTPTLQTEIRRYDLMQSVNVRATFSCSRAAIPYLKKSSNPHIITLSPPINLNPKWLKNHLAYTISKYGMSLCTLGLAEEFKQDGIAVNSLWPKTLIRTAAIENLFPKELIAKCRKPGIVADAALWIVSQPSRSLTGQCLIDEDVLRQSGVKDFEQYGFESGQSLMTDLFLEA